MTLSGISSALGLRVVVALGFAAALLVLLIRGSERNLYLATVAYAASVIVLLFYDELSSLLPPHWMSDAVLTGVIVVGAGIGAYLIHSSRRNGTGLGGKSR
jgi:hypothetical protein